MSVLCLQLVMVLQNGQKSVNAGLSWVAVIMGQEDCFGKKSNDCFWMWNYIRAGFKTICGQIKVCHKLLLSTLNSPSLIEMVQNISPASFYTLKINSLPVGLSLYQTRLLSVCLSVVTLPVYLYCSLTHGPSGWKRLSNPELCFLVMPFSLYTQHLFIPLGLLKTVLLLMFYVYTYTHFWLQMLILYTSPWKDYVTPADIRHATSWSIVHKMVNSWI